jgi:2-amino-4-hydroxy-6-hydroxymethyldihydropteridine diphosphokinase
MILIALGANLESRAGLPAQTLDAALAEIEQHGAKIVAVSPYYVTPAWPDPSEPPFVNAVAQIATTRSAHALLTLLHAIETSFGRVRSAKNAPRTLDLDLIDYDGLVQDDAPVLPHPRIAERAFVLVPLADVAPDWIHPVSGEPIAKFIADLPETERHPARLTSRT